MSLDDTEPSHRHSTRDARKGRGMNRVDPALVKRLLQACDRARQYPYAVGSALPPHPRPDDRWPMLGAALPLRVTQLVAWLTGPTHTGMGSLPASVRREMSRFLDEQGLQGVPLQDLMRCLASLGAEPVGADDLKRMCRIMSNDRRYAQRPVYAEGVSAEGKLRQTRQRVRGGALPELWARYALRVVAHALALPLQARSLWLLLPALQRAAEDVSLAAPPGMAAAAALLRRQWTALLQRCATAEGHPLTDELWTGLTSPWQRQDPLFNPLRYTDSPEPLQLRLWMAAQLQGAKDRRDQELESRLAIWPERFADQVQAWAHAVARELLDGTRVLDFGLDATDRRLPTLPESQRPKTGEPNRLHHLAAALLARRARAGDALHEAPDANLQDALRGLHHAHFRFLADHLPGKALRTLPSGQDVAFSR